jgi:peptidoglycan/xylan/chitin deacetylase (PgdA/CDA1 family)
MSNSKRQLCIFVGKDGSRSAREHIEGICEAFPDWHFTIFQEHPRRQVNKWIRSKLTHLRKEPLSFPLQCLFRILGSGYQPWKPPASAKYSSLEKLGFQNASYVKCESLNSPSTAQQVAAISPWLGICVAAPIIRRFLFSLPKLGTINLHKSFLPNYRGMPPSFWELHDGANESGVSVHWVDDSLDTGGILVQERLPIKPFATVRGLQAELDLVATGTLVKALQMLDRGEMVSLRQQPATKKANSRPPWLLLKKVERHCRAKRKRRLAGGARARELFKVCVLFFYVHFWARLRNVIRYARASSHVTILLYHRVSDEFLDGVTVGVEQFEQQLKFLERHYHVIDLVTYLENLNQPRRRQQVVITFDDGYEDNLLAALVLRRVGVPCTFFISTRIVGTDRAFEHDLERLGRRVPALSWNQVRRMKSWGFRFGNHTANHANLGTTPIDSARHEIATAITDLRRELGTLGSENWLAYPFGRREDLAEQVASEFSKLGIQFCFSAYGGTCGPGTDPHAIPRTGVSHGSSLLHLRALVEGFRTT